MPSTRDRTGSAAWRGWYNTRRWRDLARDVMAAACYRCAMCGIVCHARAPHPASPVIDHKEPHKGDPHLFWDRDNLQCLCKRCHDSAKRAEELRGWHDLADDDGWPIDPRHPANRRR